MASVKALAKLLKDDEFAYAFGDCEIIIAAGDGRESDEDAAAAAAYDRVKTAIATHERTITLSVGQLTVGVTIPEWTGVLMLCNLQSPASYMQAAFARTIPSFIMAYGDDELTLANFDDYTEDDVFLDVTGITEDDFRFLRDGGDYTDPETGVTEHFAGHLFDEVVFNDSIREFLKKKRELADYFDESREEDIFDYIPPQKTNQIFTPRWVVVKMVDELEAENPGCFDDPDNTFADLYMKSGLYITEIVKRLYRSEKMRQLFPDDRERIRHILEKQVYGMAPTRIIYLIATNYILGFDEDMRKAATHFAQADAAEAAKSGTLQALVDQCFEEQ